MTTLAGVRRAGGGLAVLSLVTALVAGAVVAAAPLVAVAAASAVALVAVVAARPVVGAVLLVGVTPLIVGIDRGDVLPLVRPNEALLGLLWLGVALAGARAWLHTRRVGFSPRPLDWAVVVLAVTGSLLPLLWLVARGVDVTQDDALYAVVLWKYAAVYALVRLAVRSEAHVRHVLAAALVSAAIVAVIGILQSLDVGAVTGFLSRYYAPFDEVAAVRRNRGTSTIAQEHGAADFLVFSLAIVTGWMLASGRRALAWAGLAAPLAIGVVAAGVFSGVLGLLVAAVAVGYATRRLGTVLAALLPVAAIGAVLLQPVIQARLAAVSAAHGLPRSWVGRWENLQTFFWPELFRDYHWVLGVRPSARVPAPEEWRDWVFIESGHTWLLWVGGLPLSLAFAWFLVAGLRATLRVVRAGMEDGHARDASWVAGVAAYAALCAVGVLMTLDPHLTLRGAADLLFPLLALAAGAEAARAGPAGAEAARAGPAGSG